MRRRAMLWTLAAGAAAGAAVLLLRPSPSPAVPDGNAPGDPPAAARGGQLPVTQAVLFSSGVGYFQREGAVDGDARVDLAFPAQDVNDLLKSMVVQDLDGGHVTAVAYDSSAPVERTLQSFAINLQGNPTFGGILNQARGERAEVVYQQPATQAATLTGTLVGVEHQRQPAGKGEAAADVELLNLWGADGLRSLKLSEVQRVRFLNPALDGEFRKALEALARSHDAQKKTVSLACAGAGKRRLKVGYVVENPVWKTSYRLVLGKDKADKPYLQAWAVVENPTDEDWKDVRMALVSGRPISFRMDLYTPLYVPRPVVEPELFASLRPPSYSGDLDRDKAADAAPPAPAAAPAAPGMAGDGKQAADRPMGGRSGAGGGYLRKADEKRALQEQLGLRMDLSQGVASAASAAKLGDYFQYALDRPVTLARQKSAMLPIAGKEVEGARVSVYNEAVQPKFPLLGLRFKNASGLHLMQGPVTVFEGSSYAGDARLPDLQPGEQRLISYAVDLGTEVHAVPSADSGRITQVKVVKGILYSTTKVRERKAYTVANRGGEDRLVLLEHPVRNDFRLVDTDRPAETASDVYRFEVKAPAGKTVTRTVTEEHDLGSALQLTNSSDDQIRFFQGATVTSAKVKDSLKQALELRGALNKTQREIQDRQRQLQAIAEDQARIRANLKELPATAPIHALYLKKLLDQEPVVEKLQAEVKKLQEDEHARKKEFEDFLANLTVE